MPKFYSRPFLAMCDSILEFEVKYADKTNTPRIKQIAEMVAVVKQAKEQLAQATKEIAASKPAEDRPAKQKEAEAKAHQQVETILTYVLESIRQEREKKNLKVKEDSLYELIEQALGIDETSVQANTCRVVLFSTLPTEADRKKLLPNTMFFYPVRFPDDEDAKKDAKMFQVVKLAWMGRYFDAAMNETIVPIHEISGLPDALKKMNKNKTFSTTEIAAVTNLVTPYHIKAHASQLDDATILVNLIRLRLDAGSKRWKSTEFTKEIDCLVHIENLAAHVFTVRLKTFNEQLARRQPTYKALLRTLKEVEDAKGTNNVLSGNQAQLLAFLRKAHLRLNRDESQSFEDKRVANNAVDEPPNYAVRYGILLYCLMIYERDYYFKWDLFEKIKQAANVTSVKSMDNRVVSFYLSALDTYIGGIFTKKCVQEFEGEDGVTNAEDFLNNVQKTIGAFRETLNEAASHGVASTRAYSYMKTTASWTSDAAIGAGIYEMLQFAAANPSLLVARPELAALIGTVFLVGKARRSVAAAVSYFISPILSEKVIQYLIAIYSGASGPVTHGTLSTADDQAYLKACLLAPTSVVPEKFQRMVASIADCPKGETIPTKLAIAPDAKAAAAAAKEQELPAFAGSGWNPIAKAFGF